MIGRRGTRLALGVVALSLAVLLAGAAWAPFPLPGRRNAGANQPFPAAAPASSLQEVAPPVAVQQIREALSERVPRVTIETPAPDAVLPPGPWTLRLRVEDWPMVAAGPGGPGPHLVVQVDGGPPRRLTDTEATMPPLTPGSHRLTVYAARPWGEAVKSPGAWQQIRLHRLAPNPLTLPARGTPQLLFVPPSATAAEEPVMVDWLLIDAPLRDLRSDDGGWRLRVSVNGDSFLVDRQTPLWLRGWRRGSNALQLELVDGRGEPLNPPFNSLVEEVEVPTAGDPPRWLAASLNPSERALLLGTLPPAPPPALPPAEPPEPPGPITSAAPPAPPATPPTPGEPGGGEASAPATAEARREAETTSLPEEREEANPSEPDEREGAGETAVASEEVDPEQGEPGEGRKEEQKAVATEEVAETGRPLPENAAGIATQPPLASLAASPETPSEPEGTGEPPEGEASPEVPKDEGSSEASIPPEARPPSPPEPEEAPESRLPSPPASVPLAGLWQRFQR